MTVENTSTEISYTGNGSVTTFAYNFLVYVEDHLFVFVNGIEQTEGFTISGLGNQNGGDVTFDTAPVSGADVTIKRIVPFTQLIDYQAYGPFDAESNEKGLDLSAMRDLQLQNAVDEINGRALMRRNGSNIMEQVIDMGNNRIINVGEPVSPKDAVRLQDLNQYIPADEQPIKVQEFPPFNGSVLNLDRIAYSVQVEKDGRTLPPSQYGFVPPSDQVTLNDPVTTANKMVVRYTFLGDGSVSDKRAVGFISDYLDEYPDFTQALEKCCLDNPIVDFEGLTLETDVTPNISAGAKCRIWRMNGANLKFNSGEVLFNNRMLSINGEGSIHLGLKLAKIAQDGTKDATTIRVYNNTPEQGDIDFVVGDYVASSLDNDYLPNSPNRVGYIENGDFNRIQSIVDNGDGTSTITVTYPFLRSADPLVSTGLIQNAWIGNPNFQIRGLRFLGNIDGHVEIDQTTITNPRGYALDIDNGAGALRKATATYNMLVKNTFIDIIRHRAYGLELGPQYRVTRQYDFGKQHLVLNMPKEGYVTYKSGCKIERQNKDGEVFYTPFAAGETTVERGKVTVEAGCYFDGAQPSDLPTSDFGPGGQVYWGKLVSITDAQHFEVPNAANCVTGGMYFAGRAVNYSRCITGTSFAAKDSYEAGTITFDGAEIECEPAYIAINGGTSTTERFEKFRVNTLNCKIKSRGLNNYDGGCYHIDTGSFIELTPEIAATPQINGSQSFNFVNKTGGILSGRYAVQGSDTYLEEVCIPYKGTSKPDEILIFNSGYIPNKNDTQLILMPPYGDEFDNFEGSGLSFDDYNQVLPIAAWFGSNATSVRVNPPAINFKVLGSIYSGTFKYGSSAGFSKRYRSVNVANDNEGKLCPFPTGAVWSGLQSNDDRFVIDLNDSVWLSQSSEQTTLAASSSVGDPTVTVTTAPTNDPTHIAIYEDSFKQWFWYNIDNVAGTVITLGAGYNSTSGVFPINGHAAGDRVSFVNIQEQAGVSGGFFGARVEGFNQTYTGSGLTQPITFSAIEYDDSSGGFYNPGQNDRLTVPNGVSRVNISGFIDFPSSTVRAGEAFRLIVKRFNISGGDDVVASFNADAGYSSLNTDCFGLGVPVQAGDYFQLEWSQATAGGGVGAFTKATFTIQKVK